MPTTVMTPRERYVATLTFQKPDRVPFQPGWGRRSTIRAWHTQGLPAGVTDYHAYIRNQLGIEPEPADEQVYPGVDFTMVPRFEEKVIERRPAPAGSPPGLRGTLVVQDWKGNVCEISDEFDTTYLRDAIDFVTRSWIKCPVETRKDWDDMARRYDPADPKRWPADFSDRCAKLARRTYVSGLVFPGPFWQLREWLGFEGLCMLLLDDPDFALEMIHFWRDFVLAMFDRLFTAYTPDVVMFNEDMAYKEKPMIGPEQCRRFMMPCWRPWVERCRAAGVPILSIDSDGHVGELIPVWLEAGLNHNAPLEVAAGNDLPAYRRRYGTRMSYSGGFDKRAIARGGATLSAEFARLQPVIDAGGYLPGCDHGVPHDVPWPHFVEYCRQLALATGWL